MKGFKLSGAAYKRVMTLLNQEMNNGLKTQSNNADIKMFPTFVRSLPDGSGTFFQTSLSSLILLSHFSPFNDSC